MCSGDAHLRHFIIRHAQDRSVLKPAGLTCYESGLISSADNDQQQRFLLLWTNWVAILSYTAIHPSIHPCVAAISTCLIKTVAQSQCRGQRWQSGLGSALSFVVFRNIVPAVSPELLFFFLLVVPLKETSLPQAPDESSQDHQTQN